MKVFLKTTASVLTVASLLAAGSAYAEPRKGDRDWHKGPPSVEEVLARMSNALDLSDEQSADLLAILQEQERDRQALHDQTMALMGAEICAQRAQGEAAILEILDAEQTELFLQMKEERRTRAADRNRKRQDRDPLDCSAYDSDD